MMNEINQAVDALEKREDDDLFEQLGRYSKNYHKAPDKFAAVYIDFADPALTAGPIDEALNLGKRVLKRWNKALHELVCGEGGDQEAKNTINKALGTPATLAAAITAVLISSFSVAPAIAAIVGVLLGRVLFPEAGKEICDFWREKLPS